MTRKASGWSAERRARQAALIHNWRPWERSTGPRTADGKARSARNAVKHGRCTAASRALLAGFRWMLREMEAEEREIRRRVYR